MAPGWFNALLKSLMFYCGLPDSTADPDYEGYIQGTQREPTSSALRPYGAPASPALSSQEKYAQHTVED